MNEHTGSLLTYALNKSHFLRQQVRQLCQRTQGSAEEGEGLNDGERHSNMAQVPIGFEKERERGRKKADLKGNGIKLAGKKGTSVN